MRGGRGEETSTVAGGGRARPTIGWYLRKKRGSAKPSGKGFKGPLSGTEVDVQAKKKRV